MKRRTGQPKKRRDRKSGQSPYKRHNKSEYPYPAALRRVSERNKP